MALGSVALATMASVVLVGVMMIVAGVAEMINAFQVKTSGKFLLCALLGALYIVAGLVTAASSDTHPDGRGQHANSYQNPRQALPADLAQQPLHALAIDGMALARSIAVTRREPRNGQLTNSSSIRSISAESSSSLRARPIDA
ncbi:hypothetical protein ACM43_01385 [Bradyrhizobium sp. CCBAU 45321]|nr:hypothetical protein [Bradyrhizobium sp. CCBAU 45321]